MKEELLKLLESKGLTIKFEGYWTGEDYVDTEYLKNTYPEILELFGEDVVCEGASEEAITKAILGLLGYLSGNNIESIKCRLANMDKFNDKIRIYLTSHWLGLCVPRVTLGNEGQFTICNMSEPHVKWVDGSDWGVAFVGYLELVE